VTYVVDASVAIKWFVRENLHAEATRVLDHAAHLEAPDLIVPEVVNIAWKKAIRGEIEQPQAQVIATAIRQYVPTLHPSAGLIERALDIALALNHPVYDCLYLACAEAVDGILITADRRFQKAAGNTPYDSLIEHLDQFNKELATMKISEETTKEIIRLSKLAERTRQHVHDKLEEGFVGVRFVNVRDLGPYFDAPPLQNIRKIIDGLSREECIDLLALMWLGQGTSGTNWQYIRQRASDWLNVSLDEGHLAYLVGLTVYLERGVTLFEEIVLAQSATQS
jgi:predicted nucleic acid-binding protein